MSDAIQIREAHFPSRAPIDAYGNGGFRFADMSHRGSIICIPSGIYGIDMLGPVPTQRDLSRILEEANDIEVLLIGTGTELLRLPEELQVLLWEKRISSDTMSTGAAVRTFNVLLAEDRAVAALLFAVE
ncbi:Mth938-like domain-containing protein [Bartonella krasnovii]|uniref:MTH938/NDUFAF3 family protein n=1 Tax=Bartonella krasnovii TaxID=2267275 RepID=A0A5B9D0J6_9HYPH|nr:MTH938/NDUFAF3 family protein [Bartonella krasnovii]QEE11860.1 putative membrame protein [Bartonella krasnovii]UNF29621.1 MTH938/NDUFAF3 family protein [Bartonella krasnovii]UNF35980.1 MTH938/NDUFAF3 family protein [Bartonella krasnovii]UNF37592.1 MTH938/NDUFAF3 family protein [Bartonella krasnovii]UNF39374.1 MTH938/NDUFAF3 family protein [Bartonella krasnovii]